MEGALAGPGRFEKPRRFVSPWKSATSRVGLLGRKRGENQGHQGPGDPTSISLERGLSNPDRSGLVADMRIFEGWTCRRMGMVGRIVSWMFQGANACRTRSHLGSIQQKNSISLRSLARIASRINWRCPGFPSGCLKRFAVARRSAFGILGSSC